MLADLVGSCLSNVARRQILISASLFHIHHSCRGECGGWSESLLKEQNQRPGSDRSEGNQRCGAGPRGGEGGRNEVFAALISGRLAVCRRGSG